MDPSAEKNPELALAKIETDFTKSSMDAVQIAENKNYEMDQEIETSVSVSEVSRFFLFIYSLQFDHKSTNFSSSVAICCRNLIEN